MTPPTTPPRLLAVPLAGPAKNTTVRLGDGDTIGRGADCALRLPHASVSRLHARIEWREGVWFVVDAASRNGLHTRGEAVAELRLERRHAVRFGDYPVRIEVESAPSAPAPAPIDEDLDFAVELEGLGGGLVDGEESDGEESNGGDDGFELEDPAEIELDATRVRPRSKERDAVEAPASSLDPRAALLAEARRSKQGLLRGEFTQQPGWVQGLVFFGALALMLGLAYMAFELVRQSRG